MNELGRKAINDVVDGERRLLLRHLRIEENLQQQVAEFAGKFGPIAIVDSFENFVSFFEGIGLDGIEGLFAVPRAAAWGAESLHDGDHSLETLSCRGHAATNVNDCEGGRQCAGAHGTKAASGIYDLGILPHLRG